MASRKRVDKRDRKGFNALCTSVCWNIWKQRNGRVFGNCAILNEWGTTEAIFDELRNWIATGAFGDHVVSEV